MNKTIKAIIGIILLLSLLYLFGFILYKIGYVKASNESQELLLSFCELDNRVMESLNEYEDLLYQCDQSIGGNMTNLEPIDPIDCSGFK